MEIDGIYKTEHGELQINVVGSKMTGIYSDGIGELAGEVENSIINGVWRKPTLGYEGIFQFTFTDENTFTGFYKSGLDKGVMRGKWNGTKINDSSKLISETPNEDSERIQDEIKDAEGNIYFGDFKDGKLHGKGTMIDSDGDRFEGDWINGDFINGKVTFTDGSTEEGCFQNYELHGKGICVFIDDDGVENIMDGHFEEGEFIHGKYTYVNQCIEEGYFIDYELNGKGKCTWESGSYYEGDWVNGTQTGKGTFIWSDGDKYEGDWLDGNQTGKGVKHIVSGETILREEGSFVDGLLNGEGKIFSEDVLWEEGLFVEGVLNGEGKIYSNGTISQEGCFVNRILNGEGKIYSDGELFQEGYFVNRILNGEGKIYSDGELYQEGIFKNGELNGIGKIYIDGRLFRSGQFENGDFIGPNLRDVKNNSVNEMELDKTNRITNQTNDSTTNSPKENVDSKIIDNNKIKEKIDAQKAKEEAKRKREREIEFNKIAKEKEKKEAELNKNKKRNFQIEYSVKLTQVKKETVVKGSVMGSIFGYDKMRFSEKKTHDKGQTIQRSIRVQYLGQKVPNNVAKQYVEQNDIDVKAGRAGTTTIVILKITES
jgi:hypothetical protein